MKRTKMLAYRDKQSISIGFFFCQNVSKVWIKKALFGGKKLVMVN